MAGVGEKPSPSNRDWLDCDRSFAQEANGVILQVLRRSPDAIERATQLMCHYKQSPLVYVILAEARVASENLNMARAHLRSAKVLAPSCPYISLSLADVLFRVGSWGEALAECGRGLSVRAPTDPVRHYTLPEDSIDFVVNSSKGEHRIALQRERIRVLRLQIQAKNGKRSVAPPKPVALLAPNSKWPPGSVDLDLARCRWSRMSEEERQAFLSVSFEDMKSHCLSGPGGLAWQMMIRGVLSGAQEFVNGCGSLSYWICPFCSVIFVDAMAFMSHIENFHLGGYGELRSSMPERITDSEMELLKSWGWDPMPIDGDDLAERTQILSKVESIVSWLIDKEAVSLNLLYIMYKFIMSRVRPVKPSVVSMCGSCGIGQLSSAHLKELLDLLKWLPHTQTDYKQENQKDSLGLATWLEETGTLFFDYGKIASRKSDDSSQPDEFFDWLFCESLLEDPYESWAGMWKKCVNLGPGIFKKLTEALDKLKLKCSSCEELKQKGGVYFLPKAIFETDIDIKPYFYDGIGSVQAEMLLIDAEVDYQKKRLLEACKVDYLAAILPIAKACLWAKLNNYPSEKILPLRPPNGLELQAPLNMILRSLWHIRRFHDTLQKIPSECTDVIDGNPLIGKTLCEIFDSWDNDKEYKPCDPRGSKRFADFTNSLVYKKRGKRTATETVKTLFQRLHSSQTPLHFEFRGETSDLQRPTKPSLVGCICLVHDLFGLHICENKFNCLNKVHTKFVHNIRLGAGGETKFKSFRELLVAIESRNGSVEQKVAPYSLLYPPHLFMTVFDWKDIEGSYDNMHEVLISLATELDISHIYRGLHSGCMYTLVSAVCCGDQRQYHCFARDKNRWIIYDGNTAKAIPAQLSYLSFDSHLPAGSWQESIERYRQSKLRPEILFFEHVE
uniref:C2H2-type domain-containing protein n=1 Tax=Oryza punctata TaxID=4537 RepID=A0A0E0MG92_ORYPU